ncbi:MAG TPA: tetratricopeptide repeat protein, partial [Dongiaceae bacterium]|nr:tetratricopeptide repeat protein [Dongiaceae bacterium]
IAAHQGRLVGARNGGFLIEFPAAVDALRGAIDLQRAAAERNSELPADRRLELRIGINLGEIAAEGDEIESDGIAVADRLQSLADPGGIMLSGAAFDRVKGPLDLGYEDLGKLRIKDSAEPVRVYRVPAALTPTSRPTPAIKRPTLPWWWPAAAAMLAVAVIGVAVTNWPRPVPQPVQPEAAPSIAVLPFETMGGDAAQAYLADGITEALASALARTPGLLVISRNAAFTYKGEGVEPVRAAVELGVRYVLAGSVGRTEAGLLIDARLIDAKSGRELSVQHLDGAWADVFQLESKLTGAVATALKLTPGEPAGQAAGDTRSPAAYDAYLQGLASVRRVTADDLASAVPELQKAIQLDPDYGQAYAALANAYWLATGQSQGALGVSYDEALAKAKSYLAEAMKHPSPRAYRVAAEMNLYQQNFDEALDHLKHAVALDPSDSESYAWLAYAAIMAGRSADGQGYIDATLRVEPRASEWLGFTLGLGQFCTARYAAAAASLEKAVASYPNDTASRILLAATYGQLGRGREAAALFDDINAIAVIGGRPPWTELRTRQWFGFKDPRDVQRLREGLSKAGVPELPFGYDPKSKERLTGGEIEKLFLGRTIRGRGIDSGELFSMTMASDDAASFSFGPLADTGRLQPQDDALCFAWPKYGRGCAAIFRNPGGTPEQENEFVWISGVDRIQFSIAR